MRFLYRWMIISVIAVMGGQCALHAQGSPVLNTKLEAKIQSAQTDSLAQATHGPDDWVPLHGGTLKSRVLVKNAAGEKSLRGAIGVAVGVHHFMTHTQIEPGETIKAVDIAGPDGKWIRFAGADQWLYNYGWVWDNKPDSEQFCRNYEYKYCSNVVIWGRIADLYRFRIVYKPLMVPYTAQNAEKLKALLAQHQQTLSCSYQGSCKYVSEQVNVSKDTYNRLVFTVQSETSGAYPSSGTSLRIKDVFLGFGQFSGSYQGLGNGYHPNVSGVQTVTNVDELFL